MKYLLPFFLLLCIRVCGQNTTVDTVMLGPADEPVEEVQTDTASYDEIPYYAGDEDDDNDKSDDVVGSEDSLGVSSRSFDNDVVQSLKEDRDLQYERPETVGTSFLRRVLEYIAYLISKIFEATTQTSIGNLFLYLGLFALIVVLIMILLRVNAFKIFFGRHPTAPIESELFDENIHEMNFENLIQEAVARQDYRRGVRLLFLYSLKILSDRHLIAWEQGKTNHDYVAELKEPVLKNGLSELSYYFDYAWYGNFKVTHEMFNKVQGVFTSWKGNVR